MATSNTNGSCLLSLTEDECKLQPWIQMISNGAVRHCRNEQPVRGDEENFMLVGEPAEYFSDGEDIPENEKYETEDDEKSIGTPKLELRQYQHELAERALEGHNVIVFAPTGCGKTRVATHIISEHLRLSKGSGKVAFLAKTIPLAVQQYKTLCKFLPAYSSTIITSQTGETMSLHRLLPHYDIIVMTPMILENHLTMKHLSHLGVFSLMIFDECHHTRKEDPYNTLMYSYHKTKEQRRLEGQNINVPQIVGLTASIGVEKAEGLEGAKKSILELCGNLDVCNLCTVRKYVSELQCIVPVPDEDEIELSERLGDESVDKINEIMRKLEEHLDYHMQGLGSEFVNLAHKRPSNRKLQEYVQKAIELKDKVSTVAIPDATRETNMHVRLSLIIIEYLLTYSAALETYDLVELTDVMDFMERRFRWLLSNEKRTTGENTIYSYFEGLRQIVQSRHFEENPNLEILAQTLQDHLVAKGEDSKGIIFVRTRALAHALASWLNRCGYMSLRKLNASRFTGSNVSEEQGGMTQAQQESIIQSFRDGEIRVLVATSVAEEGLDIPECNLVVKYNHVRNEISTVQTRGRSRAHGGLSFLLAMRFILERERLNRIRAKLMKEAIDEIQHMSPEEIRQFVENRHRDLIQEGQIREQQAAMRRQQFLNIPFRVVCFHCRKVGVDGSKMRTILEKYRVSLDRGLLDHIKVQPYLQEKPMDDLLFVGKVICNGEPEPGKRCSQPLGIVIKYKKIPFINLGIENIRFDTGGPTGLQKFKKWSKVNYVIDEMEHIDMIRYMEEIWPGCNKNVGSGKSPHASSSSDDDDDDDDDDNDITRVKRPFTQ